MRHMVTITQVDPMGTELLPPLRLKPSDPEWELGASKEITMQGPGGKLVVLALCYWKQDAPPREGRDSPTDDGPKILLQ